MLWVFVIVGTEAVEWVCVCGGGWGRDELVGAGGANLMARAIATSTNKEPALIK